jgi:hypothetical protein
MVIFGAGASADSILNFAAEPNRPGRPPLSRDLSDQRFDPYINEHPECGTLIDAGRRLVRDVSRAETAGARPIFSAVELDRGSLVSATPKPR